jgi:uncharacterized protein (DUF2147 family)
MLAATMMLADTTPAAATAATTATPAPAAAAKPEKEKVVCKTEVVTGSLFPKKTCRSVAEFSREQQEQRQNLERMQNNLGQTSH